MGEQAESQKNKDIKREMPFFNVTNFMGDHSFKLFRSERFYKGGSDQKIAESFDKTHHSRGKGLSFK